MNEEKEEVLRYTEYKVTVEIKVSASSTEAALELVETCLNNVYEYDLVKTEKVL